MTKSWMEPGGKTIVKHPGAVKSKAKRAGMSTHEWEEKHKDASGLEGKQARLGLVFAKAKHHGRRHRSTAENLYPSGE